MNQMKLLLLFSSICFLFNLSVQGQVILLKDGSAINGTIIHDDEFSAKIIILNGDTLSMNHKYIDKFINKETFQAFDLSQRLQLRHKTEGIFLNIEPLAHPFAVSVGKRFNKNWNIGGTAYYSTSNVGFGVAPYVRYYFGKDLFTFRFFMDTFVGVSKRNNSFFTRSVNEYPITGALSVGMQLPSKKHAGFYLKLGGFFFYDKSEFISTTAQSSEIRSFNSMQYILQVSLIAIQF